MRTNSTADSQVLRIAAYCRTAHADAEDDGRPIAAQLDAVEGWCRDHLGRQGFTIEPFIDAGFSGALGWEPRGVGQQHRPALGRLVERMRAGDVDVVVVQRVDRLGRSVDLTSEFGALCESLTTVRLVSVAEGLDSAASGDWLGFCGLCQMARGLALVRLGRERA